MLAQRCARINVDQQIAAPIDLEPGGAVEPKADRRRIGARCDEEVVLQLLLVAVELQVDALVDTGVTHAGELTDADLPAARIGADVMVDDARQLVPAGNVARGCRPSVSIDEAHDDVRGSAGVGERERRAGLRQGNPVAEAARRVAHVSGELAGVRLEAERLAGERLDDTRPGCALERRRRHRHGGRGRGDRGLRGGHWSRSRRAATGRDPFERQHHERESRRQLHVHPASSCRGRQESAS